MALGFGGGIQSDVGMYALTNQTQSIEDEYLRIHIRADSNESCAQTVKYKVRDRIVAYLTPLVAQYESKEKAWFGLEKKTGEIALAATQVLREEGFSYSASAKLTKETFPTRVYDGYTLPAGEYSALIIELGRGEGDNWWCVVYPPLCFAATDTNIVYKSKILEIIEAWKKREEAT